MRKPFLLVGNWKAHKTIQEIDSWITDFSSVSKIISQNKDWLTVAVAPPFPFLQYFKLKTSEIPVQLGAQDVSIFSDGSYTGEVSARMLSGLGTKYVFIGHSERRKLLNESATMIEKKISQAIKEGLIPIIGCQTIEEIPSNIRNFSVDQYVIMYEPYEAISTDSGFHQITPERIDQVTKEWMVRLNLKIRVIYGGSVTPESVENLARIPQIEGVGVGRISLDANQFSSIIRNLVKVLS